jgi:hypothetical protein
LGRGRETHKNRDLTYDLGHLGLVASVLDRIRLVETVDRLVGPRPGEKVSTGMALKAAISKMFP